jgi:hypothetical protein
MGEIYGKPLVSFIPLKTIICPETVMVHSRAGRKYALFVDASTCKDTFEGDMREILVQSDTNGNFSAISYAFETAHQA